MEYFISPNGQDDWSGTLAVPNATLTDGPFHTVQRAAMLAQPGDICYLRSGIYREMLAPAHSGTPEAPITFCSFPGEEALLTGTDLLTNWRYVEKGIYCAPMEWTLRDENQIFVQGMMQDEARWPRNNGSLMQPTRAIAQSGTLTSLTDGQLPGDATNLQGATLWCAGGLQWICWAAKITDYDPLTHTLSFDAPLRRSPDHWYQPEAGSRYVLMGARAFLDSERTWWYDADAQQLLLWAPGSADPNSLLVEAKRRPHVIDLSCRSYIHITGLSFRAGGILTDKESHHLLFEGLKGEYIGHSYARDISEVNSVRIRGHHHIIRNCEFAYSSGSLLRLSGEDNQLINCWLHHGNYGAKWQGAVAVTGRRHLICYNTIAHSGRDLLTIHGLSASLISHNDLSNAGWLTYDLGMVYGHSTDFNNTQICFNHVHDNQAQGVAMGIYFDHLCTNVIVHHNVVWNVEGDPIRMNNPAYMNLIYNNSCYRTGTLTTFDHSDRNDLYGLRYYNNIFNQDISLSDDVALSNNIIMADPGYTDPTAGCLTLQADSPAVNAGIPLAGITAAVSGHPAIGAYEPGEPIWKVGHDFHAAIPEMKLPTAEVAFMNAIANAGFEYPTLDSWKVTGTGNVELIRGNGWGVNWRVINEPFPTGTMAHELQLCGDICGVEQQITGLFEETDYTLSAWLRVSDAAKTASLGIRFTTGEEIVIPTNSTTWQRLILPFHIGVGQTSVTVFLRKESAGEGFVCCDNVGLPRSPRQWQTPKLNTL